MASLHSLGERGKLPNSGKPGDVYYHKGIVYLTLADGTITPLQKLHDTFAQLGIRAIVGPQGEPGKNGADSIVPGPKGDKGDKGNRGEQGPPGDITVVATRSWRRR